MWRGSLLAAEVWQRAKKQGVSDAVIQRATK
jgi:hypothetical protein